VEGRKRDFSRGSKRIAAPRVYDFFTADIYFSSANEKKPGGGMKES
jgi:hypothetical protein